MEPWPHLTTLLGQGWGEGLPPGRLEGMNQSFRNALRETHRGWGGAPRPPGHAGGQTHGPAGGLGVRQGLLSPLPALGIGKVLGCPQGRGSSMEARLYPALPAAPSQGIAERLTLLAVALPSLPPPGECFSSSRGLVMYFFYTLMFMPLCARLAHGQVRGNSWQASPGAWGCREPPCPVLPQHPGLG